MAGSALKSLDCDRARPALCARFATPRLSRFTVCVWAPTPWPGHGLAPPWPGAGVVPAWQQCHPEGLLPRQQPSGTWHWELPGLGSADGDLDCSLVPPMPRRIACCAYSLTMSLHRTHSQVVPPRCSAAPPAGRGPLLRRRPLPIIRHGSCTHSTCQGKGTQ